MARKAKIDRRKFMKSTIAGTTGLFFANSVDAKIRNDAPQEKPLIYRTLGATGIKLPVISMGVMNANNPNLVKAALDAGIVHLDTAHYYQNGRNEEMIGKVVKERPRYSFVIATKIPGGQKHWFKRLFTNEVSESEFLEKLDISLKRLNVDYVDILYLHNIKNREAALHPTLLSALEKAQKSGKAKFIGISTHSNEPEVIRAAIDSKFYQVVLTSYNFKQDHYLEVRKSIAEAAKNGLGIIAMKTVPGGGYLDKEKQIPLDVKASLKWILQDENVHTTIPGFTTFDQMELDLSVMENLVLDELEKKNLEMGFLQKGLYCQGCETCLKQCPHNLPIPDVMRSYMYAYGYKNYFKAYNLLSTLDLPKNVCGTCEKCSVSCVKGFNVADKIRDIARLHDVPVDFLV